MTETAQNLTNEMIEKTNKKYIHNLNERINSNNGIIISCKYLNELYNSNNVSTNTFIEVILINLGGDSTKISLKENSTIFQLAKILGNTLGISHDNLSRQFKLHSINRETQHFHHFKSEFYDDKLY